MPHAEGTINSIAIDVHGATMSADQQNKGTRLREFGWKATEQGAPTPYVVAQPNLTDLFDRGIDFESVLGGPYENEFNGLLYFINDLVSALKIDQSRLHMHGFSRGAATVALFYCDPNYAHLFASYSIAGASLSCAINDKPLLALNGIEDSTPAATNANENLIAEMNEKPGLQSTVIHADTNWKKPQRVGLGSKGKYIHQRFVSGNTAIETISHSATTSLVDGHCHPTTTTSGWLVCYATFDTGQKLVDFYIRNE